MKAKTLAKLEKLEKARALWAEDVIDRAYSLLSEEELILISQDMPELHGEEGKILRGLSGDFAGTKAERAALAWHDTESASVLGIIPPKQHRPALRVLYQRRLEKLEKLKEDYKARAGLVQFFAFAMALTRLQVCILEASDEDLPSSP